MTHSFKTIIENLGKSKSLALGDKIFLKENIHDVYIQCSVLSALTFSEVNF